MRENGSNMADNHDLRRLSDPALDAHMERCDRLLRHPTLLCRLPDGGEDIRARYMSYVAEKARRTAEGGNLGVEGTTVNTSRLTSQEIQSPCLMNEKNNGARHMTGVTLEKSRTVFFPPEQNQSEKNKCDVTGIAETYREAVCAIGEKYRHSKVQVEAIVRQTFGGSLCEAEIQRILRDVPPNFFLTHEETLSMQRKHLSETRLEMLKGLHSQQRTGL